MSVPWIPSGFLDDDTALFGPLKKHPGDNERVVEVEVDGQTWFVRHSGQPLSPVQKKELHVWVKKRLALLAKKAALRQKGR